MINETEFPILTYFLQCYAYEGGYSEKVESFTKSESKDKCKELKNEILTLKKKEVWEIQTLFIRRFGARPKQKQINDILDEILQGL